MNILFVSDVSIQSVIGGAERVLFEQTTRLSARGHDVHILTRRLPEHETERETIQGVREWRYEIDQNNAVSFFISTLMNGKTLFDEILVAHGFDCINFHQPFSAFAVQRSALCHPLKKVYTCLSFAFEEYESSHAKPRSLHGRIAHALHSSSRRWIERKALRQSHRIVALSRFTCDKLLQVYGYPLDRITMIPGGVDLEHFHPGGDKKRVREQLCLPQEKTILFTVRNLRPRMGLANLINAMKEIVKSLPDILLIIGGAGPLKENLVLLSRRLNLEPYIHFTGFIPEERLPDYYRAADLFVLPTVELEGFGLITLEALASGTPVLGTPVGGTLDILGRLDNRFLFADTSPESISKLVIDTCKTYQAHPNLWRRDSDRCRQFVEKYYSWNANVDATEALFSDIIVKS
jgi:glycosyltransferase involved in cell wall biosynthesis